MPYVPTGRPRGRPRSPDLLTPAEQRVLECLRLGLGNQDVGARLGISVGRGKVPHLEHACEARLGRPTRAGNLGARAEARSSKTLVGNIAGNSTAGSANVRMSAGALGAIGSLVLVAGGLVAAVVIIRNVQTGATPAIPGNDRTRVGGVGLQRPRVFDRRPEVGDRLRIVSAYRCERHRGTRPACRRCGSNDYSRNRSGPDNQSRQSASARGLVSKEISPLVRPSRLIDSYLTATWWTRSRVTWSGCRGWSRPHSCSCPTNCK